MGLLSKRFLILDDQLVLRKLIARQASFFSRYRVAIDEFGNPNEALRSMSATKYDLIITDIGMPGMNGIDFIKNIAAQGYHSSLFIISGYDKKILKTITDMACCMGIKSAHFLSKPYSAEAFLHSLNILFNEMEATANVQALKEEDFTHSLSTNQFHLHLSPILSLPKCNVVGFDIHALTSQNWHTELSISLYKRVIHYPNMPTLLLEKIVERLCRLSKLLQHAILDEDYTFNIQIDSSCLATENLFDRCLSYLQQYDQPPNLIGFKLTEGLTHQSLALAYENLAKIKYFGFRLIADAFGVGSLSSSNMLKLPFDQINIPVDTLKWIQYMTGAEAKALMLTQAYSIGQHNLTVYNVEDEEGITLAQAVGCPHLQGNYVAPPIAEHDAITLLEQNRISKPISDMPIQGFQRLRLDSKNGG